MDTKLATLTQSQFDACIERGTLCDASIGASIAWPADSVNLEIRQCLFDGVSFRQAVIGGAHFVDCRFYNCSLRSADLAEAYFERCRFYDSESEKGCDFSYANLRNSRFEGCDLTTATLTRTRAYGIEMRRCQASGIDFTNADFALGQGDFTAATFAECNFAYADFSRTVLNGASLAGCRLSHSLWHDASLCDADLTGCELDNVEARGLALRGADLRDARFNRLDPREIDLTGVKMHAEQGLDLLRTLGIEID
jgi:fluoroquinolone resistance protein